MRWRAARASPSALLIAPPAVLTEEGLHGAVSFTNCQIQRRIAPPGFRIDLRAVVNQHLSREGAVGSAVRACQDRWAEHGSWARGLRWRVEGVIGQMKGRGLRRIPLFGLAGARRWALWHGLTHNILLWARGR